MRIVFMGSPDFAVPTLRHLIDSEHIVVAVVTQPDRPAGRGRVPRAPAAKEFVRSLGIPVLQPERVNSGDALEALRAIAPDAFVIAAYGQILKQPLLDIPKRGSLNVHASLLPKYRGAAPGAAAILAGDDRTGVTILEVVLSLDAGPVLGQREMPIEPDDTTASLNAKLSLAGAGLLIELLPAWERGELVPKPQDDSLATYAPSIKRSDAEIDWSLPAIAVWRRVRAYNPWPVAFTTLDASQLRIWEARPLDEVPDLASGTVFQVNGGFAVRCGIGGLEVRLAQRAGRRPVSGEQLLRGMRDLVGKTLGR
jgi:methionyl-tRNA formyltransferase